MKLNQQKILAALLMLLLLTACGFQLRGQISALPFKSMYIDAPDGHTIGMDLERTIGSSSTTKVVTQRAEAEAVLQVISAVGERRILSLFGGGRVRGIYLGLSCGISPA
jgi:LPS-assembly lipoprotein